VTQLENFNWKPERELAMDILDRLGIPIAPFMRYAESVRERRARRIADVLSGAARESGRSQEDLISLFADSDQLGDLLVRALDAASRSRCDDQTKALARVLAKAADDGAKVDHLHQVVHVIGQLEPVDIRALNALEKEGPTKVTKQSPSIARVEPRDVISEELGSPILASPVEKRLSDLALINQGIAYDQEPGYTHIVTPFGRSVLAYLSRAPID
jgi:hypothetical protein